jgi:hypothetical protein
MVARVRLTPSPPAKGLFLLAIVYGLIVRSTMLKPSSMRPSTSACPVSNFRARSGGDNKFFREAPGRQSDGRSPWPARLHRPATPAIRHTVVDGFRHPTNLGGGCGLAIHPPVWSLGYVCSAPMRSTVCAAGIQRRFAVAHKAGRWDDAPLAANGGPQAARWFIVAQMYRSDVLRKGSASKGV